VINTLDTGDEKHDVLRFSEGITPSDRSILTRPLSQLVLACKGAGR
jgi:hypothetical protein